MTSPSQLKYLHAIGIPVWVSRELVIEKVDETNTENAIGLEDQNSPCPDSASSIINDLGDAKTIDQPVNRTSQPAHRKEVDYKKLDCGDMGWVELQQTVSTCQRCELYGTRTQTVFGSGHQQARWMIVGEAPSSEEDEQGQVFIGQAGQLLTNMLLAIGLKRADVYISNVLKCRPLNNRRPEAIETASCNDYLQRQIELIKPDIVLALGHVAGQHLLQSQEPLARLRGKAHKLPDFEVPVVVTYHPVYLMQKSDDKRKAWEDLKLAKTQDEDGVWWAYEVEPLQHHKGWYENEVGRSIKLGLSDNPRGWKNTLKKV
ncbi:Type-4 uracil-DNA glycosylase [Nymphon striatum]|nr:Type-4 uracil-DNA glycosylase [Nymphon striatum]